MIRQLASLAHGGARIVLHKTTPAPASIIIPQLPPQRWSSRCFLSTQSASTHALTRMDTDTTTPKIVLETRDGRKFALLDSKKLPKVKPSIVRKRLEKCKTYVESEKNIRHSPWRLNLICQMIAGLPVTEALNQLDFCEKTRAPLVKEVLLRAVEKADRKDALQKSQLEVAECFVTKGTPLKRIKPMARGRCVPLLSCLLHMIVFTLLYYTVLVLYCLAL